MSQVVDTGEMNRRFKEIALEWTANDEKMHEKAIKLTDKSWSEAGAELSMESDDIFFEMLKAYAVVDSFTEGDLSSGDLMYAKFFNPYWSLLDSFQSNFLSVMGVSVPEDYCYYTLKYGTDGIDSISLLERYDYQIPVYMVLCDRDYIAITSIAEEYFDKINAPDKEKITVEGGHYNSMMHCDELSEFVHRIRGKLYP